MDLVWNVFVDNFNTSKIEIHNVFDHHGFMKDLIKIKKNYKDDFDKFAEEVKHSLMYYYWSKCEWEVVITSFPPYVNDNEISRLYEEKLYKLIAHGQFIRTWVNLEHGKKIDVYDQVMMNWNQFINYLWDNKKLIKNRKE